MNNEHWEKLRESIKRRLPLQDRYDLQYVLDKMESLKPENKTMERTPEKEAEVLKRLEKSVPELYSSHTYSLISGLLDRIRAEVYRQEPREVWVKFDEAGHPIVSREKRTNQFNPWSKFREVIEDGQ